MAEWQGNDGPMSAEVLRCAEPQVFMASWTITLLAANERSTWDATYTIYQEQTGFEEDFRIPATLPNFVTSEVRCPGPVCAQPTLTITCPNAAGTIPVVIEAANGIFATITPLAVLPDLPFPTGGAAADYESGLLDDENGEAAGGARALGSEQAAGYETGAEGIYEAGPDDYETGAGASGPGVPTSGRLTGQEPAPGLVDEPAGGRTFAPSPGAVEVGEEGGEEVLAEEGEDDEGGGFSVNGGAPSPAGAVARPVNPAGSPLVTAGASSALSLKKGLLVGLSLSLAALL